MTAVIAMLYLVLFSAIAAGFYASVGLASQSSYNERESRRALAAAESGMEFIRYHLWGLAITQSSSPAELFDKVYADLGTRLNGSANLKGGSIGRVGDTILIPASSSDYIALDEHGNGFRLELKSDGTQLLVTSYGRSSHASAAESGVRLRYAMIQRPSSIFNFGVASRGPILLDSNARINGSPNPVHGSVLSTSYNSTPVQLLSNSAISGSISLVNPTGSVTLSSNSSVAGSTNAIIKADNIHKGVEEPEFPAVDTDIFKPYATNIVSGNSPKFDKVNLKNLYIRANTNPTFDGNIKIEGVIYIETPNKVTFSSNTQVVGVIVGQNNPTGTLAQNEISFNSNVTLQGVDMLPATADFPPELRALKGSMILAPGFRVHLNSNFGAAGGSMVANQFHFDSNATGTIHGSVINLGNTAVTMNSNGVITVANQGANYAPSGLYFGSRYVPLPASYEEVRP